MVSLGLNGLTHWGWERIATILQMAFSNEFSWMKMHGFHLILHCLFLWSKLTTSSIGLDNGLVLTRRQAIIWTSDGLVYWHIYASLGINELTVVVLNYLWWKINFFSTRFLNNNIIWYGTGCWKSPFTPQVMGKITVILEIWFPNTCLCLLARATLTKIELWCVPHNLIKSGLILD